MNMGDNVFGRYSVAVVTPFVGHLTDGTQPIDRAGLESVIGHVAGSLASQRATTTKVGGIIVSGTTGEQHTMTVDERTELYKLSVSIASRTGTPVAAGVAATTVAAAVTLAKAAVAAGCEGIMLGLPPYCKLCDEEIRTYVMAVKSVVDSSFPILLYDNVLRNGYGPSLPLLAELCGDGVIWGVKLAVAPEDFLPQARKLLELCPSIRLYTGSDKMAGDLLNYTKQASQPASAFPRFYGLTSIIGNVYPDAVGSMVSNLTSDNAESVELGEAQHLQLVSVLDAVLLGVSLPAGLKHAMRHKGLSAGYTRQPVGHVGAAKAAEIEAALERYEGK